MSATVDWKIQDAPDGPGPLTPSDDGKFMMWDGNQRQMIMATIRSPRVMVAGGGGGGGGGTSTIAGATDFGGTTGPGTNGYAIVWDNTAGEFTLGTFEAAGAVAAHVAAADPHTQYLLASAVSAYGLTLIDDTDATTARTTLGLGTMATATAADYLLANGTTNAVATLVASAIGNVPLTAKGLAGQTANLQTWRDDSVIVASVSNLGYITVGRAGVSDTRFPLYVDVTNSTNTIKRGAFYQVRIDTSAQINSSIQAGFYAKVFWETGGFNQTGIVYGMYGEIQHDTANVATEMTGVYANPRLSSTGNATTVRGLRVVIQNTGSGVITHAYGVYVDSIPAASTNQYALFTNTGDVMINTAYEAGSDTHVRGGETTSALFVETSGAGTNDVYSGLTLGRTSSGTPAAGFGYGLIALLKSSTTVAQNAGRLTWQWETATHASRAAKGQLSAYYTTSERPAITWGANSTVALLSFYDVTSPIARQVLATGAGATADNIISALQALGLVKQS